MRSFKFNIYKFIKRLFDIVVSLFIIILILVPGIIYVSIVKLVSNKSAIYKQDRLGMDGKTFKLYKFRSMVPNADDILNELLENDKELAKEYKKYKKLENDPRITKIGKFLRKTSLDELPQIINILKGDMSFIGPRPYLPRELKDMKGKDKIIFSVKPGLTGYWQAYCRNSATFKKRVDMEVYYSRNISLIFDLKIFFKTIKVVLFRLGAK